MSKAEYTTKNIGHYGLSLTTPTLPLNKEVSDVLVLRVLEASLNKTKTKNSMA